LCSRLHAREEGAEVYKLDTHGGACTGDVPEAARWGKGRAQTCAA